MGDRNFRWFLLARAITMVTGSMSSIALAFAVLEIDNDPAALSYVLTAFTVSNIVFVLFGGVVADRLPRALVIQTCYVVDILSIGAIAVLLFPEVGPLGRVMLRLAFSMRPPSSTLMAFSGGTSTVAALYE